MIGSTDSEVGCSVDLTFDRSTECQDWTHTTLDDPVASRTTLARRLRAIFSDISEWRRVE